jgi:hypothetical protein
MHFLPLSEEELQTQALAPEGVYNYQVLKSEDAVSKAGNDYIKLTLKIWDDAGKQNLIFTNLSLIKLLKHFCDVNHMQSEYTSGNVPASSCQNKSGGKVMIGIEGEKPNPNGGMYLSKNIVKDYITAPHGSMLTPAAMKPLPDVKDEFNDMIPF